MLVSAFDPEDGRAARKRLRARRRSTARRRLRYEVLARAELKPAAISCDSPRTTGYEVAGQRIRRVEVPDCAKRRSRCPECC